MPIDAIVEQASNPGDKRGTARWRIRLEVPGSFGNEPANVVVHDISAAGMLIETRSKLELGQSIQLSLPEAGDVTARVVWQDDPLFGCRFDEPLPQAALSATRLRSSVGKRANPLAPPSLPKGPEMLPERLRRLRKARGLSREALSELTGFSKPSLWAWEVGKTMPRRKNLLVLAEVFGLTEQQLMVGEDLSAARETGSVDAGQSSQELHHIIDASKRRIAQAAGVDMAKVHIQIEY